MCEVAHRQRPEWIEWNENLIIRKITKCGWFITKLLLRFATRSLSRCPATRRSGKAAMPVRLGTTLGV